jgi:uncharacterized protein YmfQ (DUF2313 family)
MSVLTDDLTIEGHNLDECYFQAGYHPQGLLDEMFPNTSSEKSPSGAGTGLLDRWMEIFQITNKSGSIADRRNRVIGRMQARGGLNARYWAKLLQANGYNLSRDYTSTPVSTSHVPVDIEEGGNFEWVISTLSPPATKLYNDPNPLAQGLVNEEALYTWIVHIYDVSSAVDIENLFNDLKPAWTNVVFSYD